MIKKSYTYLNVLELQLLISQVPPFIKCCFILSLTGIDSDKSSLNLLPTLTLSLVLYSIGREIGRQSGFSHGGTTKSSTAL